MADYDIRCIACGCGPHKNQPICPYCRKCKNFMRADLFVAGVLAEIGALWQPLVSAVINLTDVICEAFPEARDKVLQRRQEAQREQQEAAEAQRKEQERVATYTATDDGPNYQAGEQTGAGESGAGAGSEGGISAAGQQTAGTPEENSGQGAD